MLESELYDRENSDSAGGGRAAGELNAPAPSVPAAVFQPPQVVFQPPAIRPAAAPVTTQPTVSTRPAGPPDNFDAVDDAGGDDDGDGTAARRRRRRPTRSRTRSAEDGAAETGDAPASQDADGAQSGPGAEPAQDQPVTPRSRSSRTRTRRAAPAQDAADPQAAEGSAETAEDGGPDDGADSGEARDGEPGVARRRRRKRRRGSADGTGSELSADDPPDTVVHVREPGPAGAAGHASPAGAAGHASPASHASSDDVRSVKGSTRLEAKK